MRDSRTNFIEVTHQLSFESIAASTSLFISLFISRVGGKEFLHYSL